MHVLYKVSISISLDVISGEEHQTQAVVKSGAVPKFVQLLSSSNRDVREQALWALGNIAGDGPKLRDRLLHLGILAPLFNMLTPNASLALMRTATWTMANLCRGRPPPDFAVVRNIIPYIAQLVMIDDEQILIDSAWAFSYLTDGDNDQIQEVIDYGVVPRLVDLLSLGDHELQKPTLRALGNIVTGDEEQTQVVMDCKPLPVLMRLLSSPREYIRKETCWALSNMLAGTVEQIDAVIAENIIPVLIRLTNEGEAKVRREAAWAITNLICGGSDEQVQYAISQGCIKPLCEVLDSQDPKLIQVVLDGIRELLRFGSTLPFVKVVFFLFWFTFYFAGRLMGRIHVRSGLKKPAALNASSCYSTTRTRGSTRRFARLLLAQLIYHLATGI